MTSVVSPLSSCVQSPSHVHDSTFPQPAVKKKGEAIPVTGHGDRQGCETSRLPHFLDSRLVDGGEVVSLTRRPPFTPRKIPGTHLCYRLSGPHGHSAAGRIRSIEKCSDHIGNRTRDLPACSIVPQPGPSVRLLGCDSTRRWGPGALALLLPPHCRMPTSMLLCIHHPGMNEQGPPV
jgi:hypothetical protein